MPVAKKYTRLEGEVGAACPAEHLGRRASGRVEAGVDEEVAPQVRRFGDSRVLLPRVVSDTRSVVPGEKRAESVRNVTVRQDAKVIEKAFESYPASGALGAAGERSHPDLRPEQIPLPSSPVVQGPEAVGVKFILGCLLKRGRRDASMGSRDELGVGPCEMDYNEACFAKFRRAGASSGPKPSVRPWLNPLAYLLVILLLAGTGTGPFAGGGEILSYALRTRLPFSRSSPFGPT